MYCILRRCSACESLPLVTYKFYSSYYISETIFICENFCSSLSFYFLINGPFRYFRIFNTVGNKQIFFIKVCRCLDSNRGPLVSKATFLPTESQSCAISNFFRFEFFPLAQSPSRLYYCWPTKRSNLRESRFFV